MSKVKEILSAEFWVVENYNMEESQGISFEMMNAYAEYLHQSRVNAISDKLEEIKLGNGAYDTDQLKHASNCIENMKELSEECLQLLKQ